MALTGETIAEAAARYETQAVFQRRELDMLIADLKELSHIVGRGQTGSDQQDVLDYMIRQAGPNNQHVKDLNRDLRFSSEMAVRLRELENTGRFNLLDCDLDRITMESKAALYDLE